MFLVKERWIDGFHTDFINWYLFILYFRDFKTEFLSTFWSFTVTEGRGIFSIITVTPQIAVHRAGGYITESVVVLD